MFRTKTPLTLFNVLALIYLVFGFVNPTLAPNCSLIGVSSIYVLFSIVCLVHFARYIRGKINGNHKKVLYLTKWNILSLIIWVSLSLNNEITFLANCNEIFWRVDQYRNQLGASNAIYNLFIAYMNFSVVVAVSLSIMVTYYVFVVITRRFAVATNVTLIQQILISFGITPITFEEAEEFHEGEFSFENLLYNKPLETKEFVYRTITTVESNDSLLLIHKLENEPPHLIK